MKLIELFEEEQIDEGMWDKTKMTAAAAALGIGTLGANIASKIDDSFSIAPPAYSSTIPTQNIDFMKRDKPADKQAVKPPGIHRNYPQELSQLQGVDLKSKFVELMLPLIKKNNDRIMSERKHIISLMNKKKMEPIDVEYMDNMYSKYKVKNGDIKELLARVNVIPVPMALAQSALESGWGTSRLSKEALALFGQKTTNKERNIKSETDSYAAFNHFDDSIEAYMRNLNTHLAYETFREKRQKVGTGKVKELLPTLIKYSTKGKDYVKEINRMIVDNGFDRYS